MSRHSPALVAFFLTACCWALSPLSAPAQEPFRQAKTLFRWSTEGPEREEDDGPDQIQTDRPDFTEASTTVGRGRIQLESGYTFVLEREGDVDVSTHSYPEMLWRVGLFAEWFEFRIGQNFIAERSRGADGSLSTLDGAEDTYLGVKLALTEQSGWLPEMAIVPQMTVPTGVNGITAEETLPGVNWLYGWDVTEHFAMGGSTQINRAAGVALIPAPPAFGNAPLLSSIEHSYLEFAQSWTLNYGLSDNLGAYTEWFVIVPHSSLDPEIGPEHYLNGGFTYLLADNVQLDIRSGFGLNREADNFFGGAGFSFRY